MGPKQRSINPRDEFGCPSQYRPFLGSKSAQYIRVENLIGNAVDILRSDCAYDVVSNVLFCKIYKLFWYI